MNTVKGLECEKTWVEEAQRNPRAFERLYNYYFPRLYAYVCYRVGSVQDSEDLVADTFLKAAASLGRFQWQREGSFASWLFRIAHNAVTDYHRRNAGRDRLLSVDDLPHIKCDALLPEEVVLQKESFAQLRRAIATLSPRKQECITLKFFGELRNAEIASVLGLDERTVAAYICRGLEDLHSKYLEEQVAQEHTP